MHGEEISAGHTHIFFQMGQFLFYFLLLPCYLQVTLAACPPDTDGKAWYDKADYPAMYFKSFFQVKLRNQLGTTQATQNLDVFTSVRAVKPGMRQKLPVRLLVWGILQRLPLRLRSSSCCKYLPVQCPSSIGRVYYIYLSVVTINFTSIYIGIAKSVGHVKSLVSYQSTRL